MPSILVHTAEEGVTLTAQAVRRLLERGDGDAALLYLALLRHHGGTPPRALAGELRWDRGRIEAAEAVLRELGLVAPQEPPPEPADEPPSYQRSDVAEKLEQSEEFCRLTAEVERRLGKRLTTPDVGVLLGLYDYLGLPADVIYLLVCHCAERLARRLGEGRKPTLRQIEREGYAWPYCNGILKRWHEAGLHSLEEIERRDARPAQSHPAPKGGPEGGNAWMRKYIEQRDKGV